MKQEKIEILLKNKQLNKKSIDKQLAISLLESAEDTAETALSIELIDKKATSIFRELYEAIRQLGEASWHLLGYESKNHDVSLEILKDLDFLNGGQKVKLNFLERFKTLRHRANYQGFKILTSQAKEIIYFWSFVGKDILAYLKKQSR